MQTKVLNASLEMRRYGAGLRMVKNQFIETRIAALVSFITVTGNFNLSMMLKI
jgi:hypothetical protein